MKKTQMSVTLPRIYVEALDKLLEKGDYLSRQEIIRDAVRKFFIANAEKYNLEISAE